MSLVPIKGYSPNRQDYIDDPDKFNFRPAIGSFEPGSMAQFSLEELISQQRPSQSHRAGNNMPLPSFMQPQNTTDPAQFGGQKATDLGSFKPGSGIVSGIALGRQVRPVPRPRPQPFRLKPAQPPFGQMQQPQFNQQGMQQMMQFMQQMMQMFSMMSRQGGQGGFGGGFNQRPPMFGGGYGGGYGGGFGDRFMNQGPYGGGFGQEGYLQPQQPRQRPMPSYPRMQNNYSQGPFGGY